MDKELGTLLFILIVCNFLLNLLLKRKINNITEELNKLKRDVQNLHKTN